MALARAGSAAIVALVVVLRGAAAQEPTLEQVLARAAAYVSEFQQQLSGIVAEETYHQNIKNDPAAAIFRQRRLRSDLLLVRPVGADRYIEFRDVFEVDGQNVRDREERLSKLFLDPPPGAARQLRLVAEESARYNIGNFTRTMNTPLLPVSFLLPSYQARFSFRREGAGDRDVTVVRFKEEKKPTLIQTPDGEDLIARGRFWLATETGAISRTELEILHGQFRAVVDVTYRVDSTLGFFVPAQMKESYVARREHVEGNAEYGRFRRFQVKVDETIRPVKQ